MARHRVALAVDQSGERVVDVPDGSLRELRAAAAAVLADESAAARVVAGTVSLVAVVGSAEWRLSSDADLRSALLTVADRLPACVLRVRLDLCLAPPVWRETRTPVSLIDMRPRFRAGVVARYTDVTPATMRSEPSRSEQAPRDRVGARMTPVPMHATHADSAACVHCGHPQSPESAVAAVMGANSGGRPGSSSGTSPQDLVHLGGSIVRREVSPSVTTGRVLPVRRSGDQSHALPPRKGAQPGSPGERAPPAAPATVLPALVVAGWTSEREVASSSSQERVVSRLEFSPSTPVSARGRRDARHSPPSASRGALAVEERSTATKARAAGAFSGSDCTVVVDPVDAGSGVGSGTTSARLRARLAAGGADSDVGAGQVVSGSHMLTQSQVGESLAQRFSRMDAMRAMSSDSTAQDHGCARGGTVRRRADVAARFGGGGGGGGSIGARSSLSRTVEAFSSSLGLGDEDRLEALESRAAALATEGRKRLLWLRLRRGVQLMAQKRRMQARGLCVCIVLWLSLHFSLFQMSRAVLMAIEGDRNRDAQLARDAEIARVEAERRQLERAFAQRVDAVERKEREAEQRERERLVSLELRSAALATEGRKRELWFRLRRGVQLMAQKRRMQARGLCRCIVAVSFISRCFRCREPS